MAEGTVRELHGLQEGAGAVLEMETGTADEAKRSVASLPYVEEGLLDVQVFPLKPFPAFETLSAAAALDSASLLTFRFGDRNRPALRLLR